MLKTCFFQIFFNKMVSLMSVACMAFAALQECKKSFEKNAAKQLWCSSDISPDPSMVVARLCDWGWQVSLSGDLLSSGWWWHHDKTECHHFAVAGKEIGREMADSWTRPTWCQARTMADNPAMISTVRICASPSRSEQTSDRCPCISDLCVPVCEEN